MNCLDFRRAIETNPHDADPALAAHRAGCAGCSAAHEAALAFERSLQGALAIDVPANLAEGILLRQTTESAREHRRALRFGQFRWAAAVFVAIGVGSLWFANRSQAEPFAREVATHIEHEPGSLSSWAKVPTAEVDGAFSANAVRLASVPSDVNYLARCPMAGQKIVHMVMQRAEGPVTVMYLPKRDPTAPASFEHAGLKGISTSLGEGTLVLVASDTGHFGEIEAEWREAFGNAQLAAN